MTETRAQITMGLNKVIINGKDPIDPLSSICIYCTRNTSTNTDIYIYTTMNHMQHTGHTINPTVDSASTTWMVEEPEEEDVLTCQCTHSFLKRMEDLFSGRSDRGGDVNKRAH